MPSHRSHLTDRLRAPSLPAGVVLAITVTFALLTFTRGVEWARGPEPTSVSAVMLDYGVGLVAWGLALVAAAKTELVARLSK